MPTEPILLGDRIESVLIGIGIPKERWASFMQQFGGPPTCDGCEQRQADLNAADLWFRHVAAELGSAATAAISKFWSPISYLRNREKESFQSGNPPAPPATMKG